MAETTQSSPSMLLQQLPESTWKNAVASLQEKGVALVELSPPSAESFKIASSIGMIHQEGFDIARKVMDEVLSKDDRTKRFTAVMIRPHDDSAHATGFHKAGGMSRYNVHREGFVFSDDGHQHRILSARENKEGAESFATVFQQSMMTIFECLHGIADCILDEIERAMELPPHWFQDHFGPTQCSSQWHMKRFIIGTNSDDNDETKRRDTTETGQRILLPMHTDPSLISVVIHDTSSMLSEGSKMDCSSQDRTHQGQKPTTMGLQYYDTKESHWIDLRAQGKGSVVLATIFVGSVMSHLTRGQWPAVKHRVVDTAMCLDSFAKQRMAATLFVRPQLSALLPVPIPSPLFLAEKLGGNQPSTLLFKNSTSKTKSPITFGNWLKRVAKNYEKKTKG
jgi:isopenicillin N synthase-like dioxygenase